MTIMEFPKRSDPDLFFFFLLIIIEPNNLGKYSFVLCWLHPVTYYIYSMYRMKFVNLDFKVVVYFESTQQDKSMENFTLCNPRRVLWLAHVGFGTKAS